MKMEDQKKEQNEKRKRPKEYFDKHEGLYFRQEFIDELEQSISEEPIFIDDLDAWFKERFGI